MISTMILPIAFGCAAAVVVVIVVFYTLEGKIMGINEELFAVRDHLVEASNEILAKLTELEDQLANKNAVDPVLLDEVRSLAESLADIVPNPVPDEEPKPIVPDEELEPIVPDEGSKPIEG